MNQDFIWGVASSAYQIEGATAEGGRGEGIWDVGCRAGRIFQGQTAEIACDHYHRYREDVALMKELGIRNYRFSVSWPRILPQGEGDVNEEGIAFYRDLVKELKKAGITPWVTLFHWDLPAALQRKGGFLNDRISDLFADFAETVALAFGDDVKNYIVMNEPQCFVEDGHFTGLHAPFLQLDRKEVFKVAHNVLLSVGKAEKRLRRVCGEGVRIGFAPCFTPALPEREEDVELAREYTFSPTGDFYDGCFFSDALVFGRFPENYRAWMRKYGYDPSQEDMALVKSRFDFFGLNVYRGFYVHGENGKAVRSAPNPNDPLTDVGWNITPEAMYYAAKFYYERYGLPLIFTENGVAITEWRREGGDIPDDLRIDFMKRHIGSMKRAAERFPVIGYFYWCFTDNFEWLQGYSKRFGLVYVDYGTQERIPKKSAYWYKKVIGSNGEDLSAESG